MSYTGNPGKLALAGNFLGCVRNIRVKNPNHFMLLKKQISATRRYYRARQRIEKPDSFVP